MGDVMADQNSSTNSLSDLGSILSQIAAGRMSGRQLAAMLDLQRGQLQNQQYGTQMSGALGAGGLANQAYSTGTQGALGLGGLANQQYGQGSQNALAGANFALQAPSVRAGQAVRGDILSNAQDVNVTPPAGVRMGQVSGGLRPSMFSPETRSLGRALSSQANEAVQNRSDVVNFPSAPALPTLPNAPSMPTLPTAPTLPTVPEAGALESILGGVGTGASIAGALMNLLGGSGGGSSMNLQRLIDAWKNRAGNTGPLPDYTSTLNPNHQANLGYRATQNPDLQQGESSSNWWVNDPSSDPYWQGPMQDPQDMYNPDPFGGVGTQTDPMQEYYDWLTRQGSYHGGGGAPPWDFSWLEGG